MENREYDEKLRAELEHLYDRDKVGILHWALDNGYTADSPTDLTSDGKPLTFGELETMIKERWIEMKTIDRKIIDMRFNKIFIEDDTFEKGAIDEEGLDELMSSPKVVEMKVRWYNLYHTVEWLRTAFPLDESYEFDEENPPF